MIKKIMMSFNNLQQPTHYKHTVVFGLNGFILGGMG